MNDQDKLNRILKSVVEENDRKKLPCSTAFKIAEETGSDVTEIGNICNEHKIKIVKCQLGCF